MFSDEDTRFNFKNPKSSSSSKFYVFIPSSSLFRAKTSPRQTNEMLNQALHLFGSFRANNPLLFTLLVTFLSLCAFFLALAEFLKPVGRKRLQNGQAAKLPPGPSGVPILGSLLLVKSARENPYTGVVNNDTPPVTHSPEC